MDEIVRYNYLAMTTAYLCIVPFFGVDGGGVKFEQPSAGFASTALTFRPFNGIGAPKRAGKSRNSSMICKCNAMCLCVSRSVHCGLVSVQLT